MVALSPRTSPASAIFRIRVLPSDAQMESLTRPLHNTKRPRRLAFDKQYRTLGIRVGILNRFESLQRRGGKIAKDTCYAHLAAEAVLYDVQSVWCKHDDPLRLTTYRRSFTAGWQCDGASEAQVHESSQQLPVLCR